MMLFKNFRIRRVLCDMGCHAPSVLLVTNKNGKYTSKRHYCADHKGYGLYWAAETGGKTYEDTGAITQ